MADVVSMQIDQKLVAQVINQQVSAAIVAQLGDPTEMLTRIVSEIANKKVDPSNGKPSTYGDRYNTHTWVEWLAESEIRKTITKAVQDWVEANAAAVVAAVQKEMASPKRVKSMATAMCDAAERSMEKYQMNLGISFVEKKD